MQYFQFISVKKYIPTHFYQIIEQNSKLFICEILSIAFLKVFSVSNFIEIANVLFAW